MKDQKNEIVTMKYEGKNIMKDIYWGVQGDFKVACGKDGCLTI